MPPEHELRFALYCEYAQWHYGRHGGGFRGVALSLEKSNELVQKIMRKVDELLPTVDKQVPFPETCDLETAKPKPEYEAGMLRVMGKLARLGMPLK